MPIIRFSELPDDARLWVFAASDAVIGERSQTLLSAVDEWLAEWKAHGEPLSCGREWRDDHFLVIGVDQSTAGASGCSIDALFRVLQQLQGSLGTSLVGGGRVFYRGADGRITAVSRGEFALRAAAGGIDATTEVFDITTTTAAAYRRGFSARAGETWHREFLPKVASTDST
jgi:hypothetical protein